MAQAFSGSVSQSSDYSPSFGRYRKSSTLSRSDCGLITGRAKHSLRMISYLDVIEETFVVFVIASHKAYRVHVRLRSARLFIWSQRFET